jgi:hypothetical protein
MIMVILCDPIAILLVDQPHCRCEGVRNEASTDGSACALSAIALCRTLSGDFASWKVAGREQGRANRRGQDKARFLAAGTSFLRNCLHIVFARFGFDVTRCRDVASDAIFFVFNAPSAIARNVRGARDRSAYADASISTLLCEERI